MHSPTNYFVRAIEMQKRKKVTYIGTTRPLSGTFDVKKKHKLVLQSTSWCFLLFNLFMRSPIIL